MLSDRRTNISHPLIYKHPETKKPVLCFHLGMTDSFILHCDNDATTTANAGSRLMSHSETRNILKGIHNEIVKDMANDDLVYKHEWKPGDFIISDNLAVGHEASPETQYVRSDVGLRVMHRVTIAGIHKPCK